MISCSPVDLDAPDDETPTDTCERCGRLYIVHPGYSYGLCGTHAVELPVVVVAGCDRCGYGEPGTLFLPLPAALICRGCATPDEISEVDQ